MNDLEKRLSVLDEEFLKTYEKLKIHEKLAEVARLEQEVAEPEIWHNPSVAAEKNQELAKLSSEVEPWELLKTQISDMREMLAIFDEDLAAEISGQILAMEEKYAELKKALRFTGKYDGSDAILRITAGVGGVEAMDWAGMLERMYLRFLEKSGFKVAIIERTVGEKQG